MLCQSFLSLPTCAEVFSWLGVALTLIGTAQLREQYGVPES